MGNETKGRREGEDCRKERRTKQKEKDHCFVTSMEGVKMAASNLRDLINKGHRYT